MCEEAVPTVYELEHMGLPFNRTPDGKIAQRYFGGHTNNDSGKPVRRAAYAADRTGHMISADALSAVREKRRGLHGRVSSHGCAGWG